MANTLFEYYKSKGQNLPGIKDRAKTYESLGMGAGYQGTTDQNISLLNRLKTMPVATPKPTITQSPAVPPTNPVSDPNKIKVGNEEYPSYTSLFDSFKKSLGLDSLVEKIKTSFGNTPKMADIYNGEVANAGIDQKQNNLNSLNSRIANIDSALAGSDKDIRDRINRSGGIVTDSQVQRLVASESEPLLNEYKTLVGAKGTLEGNVTSAEARAKSMAEMKYNDAIAPNTAVQEQYKFLSDLADKSYDTAEKDLTKRIELAKEQATNRKADVVSTQTDENGNVSIVTRETDGSFKINSVGKIGKPVKATSGSGTDTNDVETYAVEAINDPDFNITSVPQNIRADVLARKKEIMNEAAANNSTPEMINDTTPITVQQLGGGIKDTLTKNLPGAYKKNWQYTKDFFKGLFGG